MGRSGQSGTSVPGSGAEASDLSADRRRILDAMVNTVAERGYPNTDIEEVIERAGVSHSVFSRFFASKEECFVETINDSVRTLIRAVEAALPPDATWPERVRIGMRAFVGALVTDPARTRLAMVEAGQAGPAAALEVRRAYQRFVPYFDEGRRHVSFDLPEPMSDAVVGGIALTVQHHVADGEVVELWNVLPDLTYFALVPYLGPRRASALALN
jgi:AcrR family transcriptional regulator